MRRQLNQHSIMATRTCQSGGFRCWDLSPTPTPLNPGDARHIDSREFGPEKGRRRAERVKMIRVARGGKRETRLSARVSQPLRILEITCLVAPQSQHKTQRSRSFATVEFLSPKTKWRGSDSNLRRRGYEQTAIPSPVASPRNRLH